MSEGVNDITHRISAKWARETATKIHGEKVSKEIKECDDAIKDAVKKNNFSTNIYRSFEALTIQDLKNRGFEVKQYDSQRDGSSLTISW